MAYFLNFVINNNLILSNFSKLDILCNFSKLDILSNFSKLDTYIHYYKNN